MARGRKPALVTSDNIAQFNPQPITDIPQQIHHARAEALRPATLTPVEKEIWNTLAPQLAMLGRLQPHFVPAVSDICYLRSEIHRLRQKLAKEGSTFETSGRNGEQEKSRPQVAQLNELFRQWRSLLGEFGLAPASERSLKSDKPNLHDNFDAF